MSQVWVISSDSRPKFQGDSESEEGIFEIPTLWLNMAKSLVDAKKEILMTFSNFIHLKST